MILLTLFNPLQISFNMELLLYFGGKCPAKTHISYLKVTGGPNIGGPPERFLRNKANHWQCPLCPLHFHLPDA